MAIQSSGTISLNDMHVEAGGGSGTYCTANDSDIRGLISKGSGAYMSFNEWYGASGTTFYNVGGASGGGSYSYNYVQWAIWTPSNNGAYAQSLIIQNNSGNTVRGPEIRSDMLYYNQATMVFPFTTWPTTYATPNNSWLLSSNISVILKYNGSQVANLNTMAAWSNGWRLYDPYVTSSSILYAYSASNWSAWTMELYY
jgi:hypothetical protein